MRWVELGLRHRQYNPTTTMDAPPSYIFMAPGARAFGTFSRRFVCVHSLWTLTCAVCWPLATFGPRVGEYRSPWRQSTWSGKSPLATTRHTQGGASRLSTNKLHVEKVPSGRIPVRFSLSVRD